METVLILLVLATILLAFNTASYLMLRHRIEARDGERSRWRTRLLLLGPFAVAWYRSGQVPPAGGSPSTGRLRPLARAFLLPWTVYALAVPLPLMVLSDLVVDSGTNVYEVLMWSPVIYLLLVVPFLWGAPMVLAGLILLGTRVRKRPLTS